MMTTIEHWDYDEKEMREKEHREALVRKQHMEQCPACGMYDSLITNVHCQNIHGMSKKEVEAKYGKIMTFYQKKREEMRREHV